MVLVTLPVAPASAVTSETDKCIQNDSCFVSDVIAQCVNGVGVAPVVPGNEKLSNSVPAPYHDIFIAAGNKQGAPAALVAAVFFAGEHGSHWPDPGGDQPGGGWAKRAEPQLAASNTWPDGFKGSKGAFQFLFQTWEAYKIDGDGDGNADVENLTDGAFGAANYLAKSGGKSGASDADLRKAVFAYNHSQRYVNTVMESYNAFLVDGTGANNTGNLTQSNVQNCGGNIGVSANGFVFPQKTTKASLKKNGWNPNCTNGIASMTGSKGNPVRSGDSRCHHDYLAADILNDAGTTVVSPRPGRVIATKDKVVVGGSASGASVRIYSDPALGGDGLYYYLTHMLPKYKDSTAGVKVSEGQIVTAGQTLGVVGTAADAQGTIPHTHFDVSPAENGFSRSSKGTEGPLLDPQPVLKASYEALPEN